MSHRETKDILRIEGIRAKGYGIIPKIIMQDKRLKIESKAIYSYFCTYAGAGDTAFPSVGKICFDLGIGEERYRKYFRDLVKYGYITVEQLKENGKYSRNIYTLEEKPQEQNTPKSPYTEIQSTEDMGTNNNSNKSNKKENKVSQSFKPTSENTSSDNDDDIVEKIIDNAEVYLYESRLFIEQIIKKLYTDSSLPYALKMGLTHQQIKDRLKLLQQRHIDRALTKFRLAGTVKNKELYFSKCLLTAIVEADLDFENEDM